MADAFQPSDRHTYTINVGAASTPQVFSGDGGRAVRLYNAGSQAVFVRFGNAGVVASLADMPLAPGAIEVFNGVGTGAMAAIVASGNATLYATLGEGA